MPRTRVPVRDSSKDQYYPEGTKTNTIDNMEKFRDSSQKIESVLIHYSDDTKYMRAYGEAAKATAIYYGKNRKKNEAPADFFQRMNLNIDSNILLFVETGEQMRQILRDRSVNPDRFRELYEVDRESGRSTPLPSFVNDVLQNRPKRKKAEDLTAEVIDKIVKSESKPFRVPDPSEEYDPYGIIPEFDYDDVNVASAEFKGVWKELFEQGKISDEEYKRNMARIEEAEERERTSLDNRRERMLKWRIEQYREIQRQNPKEISQEMVDEYILRQRDKVMVEEIVEKQATARFNEVKRQYDQHLKAGDINRKDYDERMDGLKDRVVQEIRETRDRDEALGTRSKERIRAAKERAVEAGRADDWDEFILPDPENARQLMETIEENWHDEELPEPEEKLGKLPGSDKTGIQEKEGDPVGKAHEWKERLNDDTIKNEEYQDWKKGQEEEASKDGTVQEDKATDEGPLPEPPEDEEVEEEEDDVDMELEAL